MGKVTSNGLFTRMPSAGYQHAKGGCYVYGTAGEGVDFGVIIEGEGALYLSRGAIVEAAGVLGLTYMDDALELEQENAYLSYEVEKLRTLSAELEEIVVNSAKAAADTFATQQKRKEGA